MTVSTSNRQHMCTCCEARFSQHIYGNKTTDMTVKRLWTNNKIIKKLRTSGLKLSWLDLSVSWSATSTTMCCFRPYLSVFVRFSSVPIIFNLLASTQFKDLSFAEALFRFQRRSVLMCFECCMSPWQLQEALSMYHKFWGRWCSADNVAGFPRAQTLWCRWDIFLLSTDWNE